MTVDKKLIKNIINEIKKFNTIIIARHRGADPDALGAQIGLKDLIMESYPKKSVYAVGLPVSKFKFMGQLDKMNEELYNNALLIVVDTPDKGRIEGVDINKFNHIIKIDHHPFVDKFSDIEWIDDSASSACQIIIELSFNSSLKMTKFAAERLFMGIVADTNRFLFSYTSAKTFDLVKRLIESMEIDITALYEELYMRSINEMKLQGYVSQNIEITDNGVAYITLKDDIIKEFNVDAASAGNIINNFNYIEGILVWLIISEDVKQNIVRINIRSRGPIINAVAEQYGGGGHKFASGIRLSNNNQIDEIVNKLDDLCREYQNAQK